MALSDIKEGFLEKMGEKGGTFKGKRGWRGFRQSI